MTTFYIDTSAIMNESFLKSSFSQSFLKACAILHYNVVIPEIVIDELKGNYPKKIKEKNNAFSKAQNELSKLVDLNKVSISVPDMADLYSKWLNELVKEHGIIEAPYPEISAKELVEKSYEIKKPFKESGEGHKDYIVWETIKAHILSDKSNPPNVLLTNNTKDFCTFDNDGNPILHEELSNQIDDDTQRPKIYTSIKSAFDNELSPNLQGISLKDLPELGEQDIYTMTGEYISQDLPGRTLYALEGVPFSNDISISNAGLHTINNVVLKAVDNEVVIEVSGTLELELNGFIYKSDYYIAYEEHQNLYVEEADWNDHVMLVGIEIETAFELTIFYSIDDSEVTGYEISLPHEIEDEWPYK